MAHLERWATNMKRILLLLLLVTASASSQAQDLVATIRREAQSCAKALLASDYDGVVTYTHKRVVAMMGGREAMIATLKRGASEMHSEGCDFADATVGAPAEARKIGSWLTSMVPQHIVMKVPGGKLHQDSVLLGISEDQGKSWVFIDLGPISKAQLAKVFPELDGQIQLPERQKPVFQKE